MDELDTELIAAYVGAEPDVPHACVGVVLACRNQAEALGKPRPRVVSRASQVAMDTARDDATRSR